MIDQLGVAVLAIGAILMNMLYVPIVCVVSEYIAPVERITMRERSLGLLLQVVGAALSAAVVIPIVWLWQQIGLQPYLIPLWSWLSPLGTAGYAAQIIIALLIADFLRYWRHRAEHHAWFWPIHAVHHAPTKLHAANSLGHPLQAIPEILFVSIPLSLVVFDGPAVPAMALFISSFLTHYIHSPTQIHFGPMRRVVVDNRFHRIHHSTEERHFDKNFGICFSVWDWMFGTAHWPAADEWPQVGVEGIKPPENVRDFLMLPLRVVRGTSGGEPSAAPHASASLAASAEQSIAA